MTVPDPLSLPATESLAMLGGRRSLYTELRDALRRTNADHTTIPLRRAVFLLAVPMVLELILESTFAVVDIYFVAKLGSSAVATVGLTDPVVVAARFRARLAALRRVLGRVHLRGVGRPLHAVVVHAGPVEDGTRVIGRSHAALSMAPARRVRTESSSASATDSVRRLPACRPTQARASALARGRAAARPSRCRAS